MHDDTFFARLVSLGCHDVRTPLATVHGFAKTLERTATLGAPADRYIEMIGTASAEMTELLDELSLAARIEAGRYDPALREADTLALAQAAAERLGRDRVRVSVRVSGDGAVIVTDLDAVGRSLAALMRAAVRHGGLDTVDVVVRATEIEISPLTAASAPVVLGEELLDFRAAVAVRTIETLGGAVDADGSTLSVRLASVEVR
jgi:signal transduction histidine kinase